MYWRTDKPKGSPIVAYHKWSNIPEVLLLAKEPYPHYYDSAGEEVPTDMIQKWAPLDETSTTSNLDDAAEKYADSMGLKGFDRIRTISDFKAGVEWKEQRWWADLELQSKKKMEEKEIKDYKEYLEAKKLEKLPITPKQKMCKHQWDKTWTWESGGFQKCPLCGRVETF